MCPESHLANINYLGQMHVLKQQVLAITELSVIGGVFSQVLQAKLQLLSAALDMFLIFLLHLACCTNLKVCYDYEKEYVSLLLIYISKN